VLVKLIPANIFPNESGYRLTTSSLSPEIPTRFRIVPDGTLAAPLPPPQPHSPLPIPENKKTKKSEARKFLEKYTSGPLTIGRMISSTRLSKEISQIDFAKKLKISVAHLCDIEKGRKTVSPERAVKFAKILGLSEKQFIRVALQDELNKAGLNRFQVMIEAA